MKRAQTVLIITDAEDIHSGIGWLLQKRSYRAIEVARRAALDHVCHEIPSLVLIDSDHPSSESLALARSLRRQSVLAVAQIVIVTSDNRINSTGQGEAGEHFIDRNDSVGIMNLLSDLDSERQLELCARAALFSRPTLRICALVFTGIQRKNRVGTVRELWKAEVRPARPLVLAITFLTLCQMAVRASETTIAGSTTGGQALARQTVQVPESSTMLMLGTGMAVLAGLVRRRRRKLE